MAKKSWGIPYKGSKNTIAEYIVDALPKGQRLVDLFAGGCAITDYALKNTVKFNSYLVNDINVWSPQAYEKALMGGFNDEERWISHEDFFRLKDSDPYVCMCFSFGSDCKSYMYSKELEPYKRALHYIVFWEDYKPMEDLCPQVVDIINEYCKGKDRKGRRLASGSAVADHIKQKGSVEYWQSNPMFRAVKIKWTPERRGMKGDDMEGLQSLERLETSAMSYADYVYREGDVVYCDPPYKGTNGYGIAFDGDTFWEWVRTRNYPVYVSEYQAPEDFVSIWSREKRSLLNSTGLTAPRTEHLFLHKRFINETP